MSGRRLRSAGEPEPAGSVERPVTGGAEWLAARVHFSAVRQRVRVVPGAALVPKVGRSPQQRWRSLEPRRLGATLPNDDGTSAYNSP